MKLGYHKPTVAQERADAIADALEPILPGVLASCEAVALANTSVAKKYDKLLSIAVVVMDRVLPFTPCGQQCSHCCHMAVTILDEEAKRIAQFLDRRYVKQARCKGIMEVAVKGDSMVQKYLRVPCPFLKEGKCSVYEVRPFACRLHHTVSPTNDCCDLKVLQVTPAVNLGFLEKTHAFILFNQAFGDIRDYFPEG
jgi:Fe-S-cluster containining protein